MPTEIEWARNPDGTKGETWNVLSGCTPISIGCEKCYAKRMARRLAGRHGYPAYPHHFDVTLHPDKLDRPLHWRKPRRVFVVSMGDLFHEKVPFAYVDKVMAIIQLARQHTFLMLTKRSERMAEYYDHLQGKNRLIYLEEAYRQMEKHSPSVSIWPIPWLWLGVTVENQEQADKRIPVLLQTPAAVRFVSVEPMLEPVTFNYHQLGLCEADAPCGNHGHLSWVICGAETGPGARPMDLNWARDLRDQCTAAGASFFFKRDSNGNRELDGRLWEQYPEDICQRFF